MLEIEFFAATVAGSSGSGFRSRYSAHCEGERWEGGGVRRKTRGGRGDELRLFVVGRAERRAARLTSPAVEGGCCCAKHPEMHICRRTGASAACAAREKGVGHRAGRSCRVGRTSRREPSKYLKISLLCRSGTRIALSNEVVISMVCRSRFPSHVTRRRVLGGAEVDCRRRPFRDNPLDQKIKKTSET